jgi:RNA binding exosome subunit
VISLENLGESPSLVREILARGWLGDTVQILVNALSTDDRRRLADRLVEALSASDAQRLRESLQVALDRRELGEAVE